MPQALHPSVVLVADRTLSADYRVLFEGMLATAQTTRTPGWLMRRLLSPRLRTDSLGRAKAAPLGIRRLESALLSQGGLAAEQVVCATPESLPRLLGPWVKVVGVSSGDPLGGGMSNTTSAQFFGGRLYTQAWTDRLMRTIRRAKEKHGFRVFGGGPGAWQWRQDASAAARHGLDCVFEGYFESRGPGVFRDALAGRPCPPHVRAEGTALKDIRPIRGPSVMGVVEVSRGCGRGCRFCFSARLGMEHLPVDAILADLATNTAGGLRSAVLGSEDFFRYGAGGAKVDFERLVALLEAVAKVDGLSFVQVDHANISSIAQLTADQLREVRRLLTLRSCVRYPWLNIGIESASGQLVHANGPGKIAPFDPKDWPDLVRQTASRVSEAGFLPLFSVVLGLPGETPADVAATKELVGDLSKRAAAVFPIFYEPLPGRGSAPGSPPSEGGRFDVSSLRDDHLDLFTACYEMNFRWIPRLFADNQRAGGVGWTRRIMLQCLGRGQVFLWRRSFRRLRRQIASRGEGRPAPQKPKACEVSA